MTKIRKREIFQLDPRGSFSKSIIPFFLNFRFHANYFDDEREREKEASLVSCLVSLLLWIWLWIPFTFVAYDSWLMRYVCFFIILSVFLLFVCTNIGHKKQTHSLFILNEVSWWGTREELNKCLSSFSGAEGVEESWETKRKWILFFLFIFSAFVLIWSGNIIGCSKGCSSKCFLSTHFQRYDKKQTIKEQSTLWWGFEGTKFSSRFPEALFMGKHLNEIPEKVF